MPSRPRRLRPARYFGRRAASFDAPAFHLTESVYRPAQVLPPHSHRRAHLCLVLSGSYTESLGGERVERRPADLIFYPPDVCHAESHHRPGRHFLVELSPDLTERLAGRHARYWRRAVVVGGAAPAVATRLYGEFRRRGGASREGLERSLAELVRELGSPAPTAARPAWLTEVARLLHERLEDPPSLTELAERAGVHPAYLGRAFRRAYGCTPGQLVRRLRIEQAQRTLGEGGTSLAEVALEAGFCDQSHLNRVFKRGTGLTPGVYRRLVDAD